MANGPCPPSLPPPSFLGRPQQRQPSGYTLPSIHTLQHPPRDGPSSHPIQLPPLRPPSHYPPLTDFRPSQALPTIKQPTVEHRPASHMPHLQQATYQAVPPQRLQHPTPAAPISRHVFTGRSPSGQTSVPSFSSFTPERSPAITGRSPSASSYAVSPESTTAPHLARLDSVETNPETISRPPPFTYQLSIRQQPAAARACGFGERDRRVIDPPPILELKITDSNGAPVQDERGMLALSCTLMTEDGQTDDTEVAATDASTQTTRRLMGTLVASPYHAKDEQGVAGLFFVFPDLSCRSPGSYRLRFKLIRIDPLCMAPGVSSPSVASVMTDVFSVYTAKDFPGMRASSALLKALRRQGLNVGVKKGSEARKGKTKAKKESSSSDDEDEEESESEEERRGSTGSTTSSTTGVSPKTMAAPGSKRKVKRKRAHS